MNFIIVYNRATGYTDKIIPEADNDKAYELFEATDLEYEDNPDIEVNYVTAKDEANLRKYWGRFFNRGNPLP
jgi:hypothetical protein